MPDPLEAPRSADDLYLAREVQLDGVPLTRPLMTGDVFRSVAIPGVDELPGDDEQLALIVSHPCSMRQGSELNDQVQMIRVVKFTPIPLTAWPKMHYDKLPLPDLTVVVDPDDVSAEDPEADLQARTEEGAHAALLDCRGRVRAPELVLERRIACLNEQGVAFLHQRMSHNDTRYAPATELLITSCEAVFAEIELWEVWNEKLISTKELTDDVLREESLRRVALLFDEELSQKRPIQGKKNGWYTLRGDLSIPKRRAAARREISRILNGHVRSLSQGS